MKYYKRQRKKREEENGGKSLTNCAQQSPRIFSSLARRKLHCRVGVLFFSSFFSFSFHSSVTFCILFRHNLKLILKLRWSFVIFLCKKFSQGVREGKWRGERLLRTDAHFHGTGTDTYTHTHTETVYYDYYLCGLNPQLLKRSFKFNIHLHFGQKTFTTKCRTFQCLMRERERKRGEHERETDSFTSRHYNLRPISAASATWRPQPKTDEVESQPPHNLLLLFLLCTVKQKLQIRRHKSAWKQVEQSELLALRLLTKLRFHFGRTESFHPIKLLLAPLAWKNVYFASFIINLSNSFE